HVAAAAGAAAAGSGPRRRFVRPLGRGGSPLAAAAVGAPRAAATDGGGRREPAVHLARGRAPSASCLSVALDPGLAGVHRERGRRGDGPELLAAAQPALHGRAAPPVAAGGTGGRTFRHAGRRGGAFAPTPGALSGRRVG